MTDPVVHSPQAELRAAVLHVLEWDEDSHPLQDVVERQADEIVAAIFPLFAARVAAIEAERTVYLARSVALEHELAAMTAERDEYVRSHALMVKQFEIMQREKEHGWREAEKWEERASWVDQRVAAERTQAAAQAWAQGEVDRQVAAMLKRQPYLTELDFLGMTSFPVENIRVALQRQASGEVTDEPLP